MSKGKHKISKAQAKKYADEFDKQKKDHPNQFKDIPEGFLFEAADVKTLMSHPDTEYFMIRFGFKKTKKRDGTEKDMVAPILMVLNSKMEIINPDSGNTIAASSAKTMDSDEEGGGFLDEAEPTPPPPPPSLNF
jgi:hypothetical protein